MRAVTTTLALALLAAATSAAAQETQYEVRNPVRGLSVTPLGQPAFSLADLSFTGTAVGARASARSVSMTNIGQQALGIKAIGIQGGDGYNGFFLEGHSCGAELAPGQSCTLSVSAQIPDGSRMGTLAVELRNSLTRISRLQLRASLEEAPPVELKAVASLSAIPTFPATALGFSSIWDAQLSNIGTAELSVESLTSSLADFTVTHSCNTIAAGASCPVRIEFAPKASGTRNATLSVKTSADAAAKTYALQGSTSLGSLAFSPSSVDFGERAPSSTSEQLVTVTNQGTGPTVVNLSGLTAPMSIAANGCTTALAAKASCTFKVVFKPTNASALTQTLTATGSQGVTTRSLAVSGAGVVDLYITADTLNYDVAAKYSALYGALSGPVRVRVTVQPGVNVRQSTGVAALTTGALPAGSVVTLVNKGYIVGKGGAGGKGGGSYSTFQAGTNGSPGGDAVYLTVAAKIDNALGAIYGGGGGGGGGAGVLYHTGTGGGGGGGAGAGGALGGSRGCGTVGCGEDGSNTSYSPSTTNQGALGGSGLGNTNGYGGRGGNYGQPGEAGTVGYDNRAPGGLGGAAGYSVRRNGATLTWIATGKRAGPAS